MDAVEYLKAVERMCNTYKSCADCPYKNCSCDCNAEIENAKEMVAIVEKWAAEHPTKTRQSEFLKMFPNAATRHEVITICPQYAEKDFKCPRTCCPECKKAYWLAEVE